MKNAPISWTFFPVSGEGKKQNFPSTHDRCLTFYLERRQVSDENDSGKLLMTGKRKLNASTLIVTEYTTYYAYLSKCYKIVFIKKYTTHDAFLYSTSAIQNQNQIIST